MRLSLLAGEGGPVLIPANGWASVPGSCGRVGGAQAGPPRTGRLLIKLAKRREVPQGMASRAAGCGRREELYWFRERPAAPYEHRAGHLVTPSLSGVERTSTR